MSRVVETIAFVLMFVGLFATAANACAPTTVQDAGTCVVPPGSDGCVLPALARAVARSAPWDLALTTTSQSCGVSKPVAESIWASHVQAEVIEGFVPRAIGGDAGITPNNGGDR